MSLFHTKKYRQKLPPIVRPVCVVPGGQVECGIALTHIPCPHFDVLSSGRLEGLNQSGKISHCRKVDYHSIIIG